MKPNTSPARRLAHEERRRLNLERYGRECEDAAPVEAQDGVTVRVRLWTTCPGWNAVAYL